MRCNFVGLGRVRQAKVSRAIMQVELIELRGLVMRILFWGLNNMRKVVEVV
jgi:hypothetical protein